VVPLTAPFLVAPNIEIGTLATAIIPPLLASFIYPTWGAAAVLAGTLAIAAFRIATTTLPPGHAVTASIIMVGVAIAGCLAIVSRHRFTVLDRARAARLRESEESERQSERKYRDLFEAVTDGIFIADVQGRILEANDAACRQLGYTREELLALSLPDFAPDFEGAGTRRIDAMRDTGRARFEALHRRKDGSTIPVDLATVVVDFQGRKAFLGVARDVTERNRAQEERDQLERRLHRAGKMETVGRLAGGVAHDFNNLLTVVLGNLELLENEMGPRHPLQHRLGDIRRAGKSAALLVNHLLAFSRQEVVEPRVVNLDDVIGSARQTLQGLVGEDVAVEFRAGAAPCNVRIDPAVVERALVNLAVNARDAMPNGGKLAISTGCVEVAAQAEAYGILVEPGTYAEIAVADTGVGMTDEVKAHLFEPFYSTKPRSYGTGLGLATVYGAVQQAGGHIQVESALHRGTTFRLRFPLLAPEPEGSAVPAAAAATPGGKETILYAEDDAALREFTAMFLSRSGYRVLPAADGPSALELAAQFRGPIDLLFTDTLMPGMDGRQLATRLSATHPQARVLYTSGYPEDVLSERGTLDDTLDFLPKPYTPSVLAARIRRALDSTHV
jgi:PAS domain S-box-containing protein